MAELKVGVANCVIDVVAVAVAAFPRYPGLLFDPVIGTTLKVYEVFAVNPDIWVDVVDIPFEYTYRESDWLDSL